MSVRLLTVAHGKPVDLDREIPASATIGDFFLTVARDGTGVVRAVGIVGIAEPDKHSLARRKHFVACDPHTIALGGLIVELLARVERLEAVARVRVPIESRSQAKRVGALAGLSQDEIAEKLYAETGSPSPRAQAVTLPDDEAVDDEAVVACRPLAFLVPPTNGGRA